MVFGLVPMFAFDQGDKIHMQHTAKSVNLAETGFPLVLFGLSFEYFFLNATLVYPMVVIYGYYTDITFIILT